MKKEQMIFVENCFRNIQHEKDVEKNLKLISNAIKREFGVELKISIIDNRKNQFFGMCTYPMENEIEMLTYALMDKGTIKDIDKIHMEFMKRPKVVEIDSLLLYDSNLNATPAEVTAILLHELGHIVMSDNIIHKFKRSKEYMLSKFDSKTRTIINQSPIAKRLFIIPVTQIFSDQFNAQLLKEKKADNMAIREGYGEDLFSILGKLVANGKGGIVKKSEAEADKEIELTVDWLVENIRQLEFRKDRLKKNLRLIQFTTPSKHVAKIIDNFRKMFYEPDRGIRGEFVLESFILSSKKKQKAPNGVMDSSGKVKKLITRDLDIYRAELERVHCTDDKIFLLERLYDLMDHAEYALYLLKEDPKRVNQSETMINLYIESLNDLIKMTNAKKISQERFGLFIKYPSEYEG